jgi:translocation and assembly module TamB
LLAGDADKSRDWMGAVGLDDLSVRQSEGDVRETIVSLGKQLSRRWYVGYERSLSTTAGTWQLVYRAARHLTVRAQTGLDHSMDLIWSWRWH